MRWFKKEEKPNSEISWPARVASAVAALRAKHASCDENCATWVVLRELEIRHKGDV